MRTHPCTKWLSDERKNGPLSPDDLTWAEETWVKSAVEAGWNAWGLVLPADVSAQMDVRRYAKLHRSRGVVVITLLMPEAARAWLSTR